MSMIRFTGVLTVLSTLALGSVAQAASPTPPASVPAAAPSAVSTGRPAIAKNFEIITGFSPKGVLKSIEIASGQRKVNERCPAKTVPVIGHSTSKASKKAQTAIDEFRRDQVMPEDCALNDQNECRSGLLQANVNNSFGQIMCVLPESLTTAEDIQKLAAKAEEAAKKAADAAAKAAAVPVPQPVVVTTPPVEAPKAETPKAEPAPAVVTPVTAPKAAPVAEITAVQKPEMMKVYIGAMTKVNGLQPGQFAPCIELGVQWLRVGGIRRLTLGADGNFCYASTGLPAVRTDGVSGGANVYVAGVLAKWLDIAAFIGFDGSRSLNPAYNYETIRSGETGLQFDGYFGKYFMAKVRLGAAFGKGAFPGFPIAPDRVQFAASVMVGARL